MHNIHRTRNSPLIDTAAISPRSQRSALAHETMAYLLDAEASCSREDGVGYKTSEWSRCVLLRTPASISVMAQRRHVTYHK